MTERRLKICLIGSFPPRRCGIATFTSDIADALRTQNIDVEVFAMDDGKGPYEYGGAVTYSIQEKRKEAYREAANEINRRKFDLILIQHEYGIFGGPSGSWLLELVKRVNPPIVLTLHTILTDPPVRHREVMEELLGYSERVITMTPRGTSILCDCHRTPRERIAVIPHGVPDFPTDDRDNLRKKFEFEGRNVVMTFGLLAPDKGIEYMVRAMTEVCDACPNALYVVVGQTHPHYRAHHGEKYRRELEATIRKLGLIDAIRFVDRFVDLAELTEMLVAADCYVTPYLKREQITSGTLSYAVGAGKAIVSTPYWHAEELLADGAGILVPIKDEKRLAKAVCQMVGDRDVRHSFELRCRQRGQQMRWPLVGASYRQVFEDVMGASIPKLAGMRESGDDSVRLAPRLPRVELRHLLSMTDDVGIFQHATYDVPNRNEGYCVDDNARALQLCLKLAKNFGSPYREVVLALEGRFLSFVHHAWNPEAGAFRNFMSYDRRWLETAGSADANARAVWALGSAAVRGTNSGRRALASELFNRSIQSLALSVHPRSNAFALLGLVDYVRGYPDRRDLVAKLDGLASSLFSAFVELATDDWCWFEDSLTYDNARLPQALVAAGAYLGNERWIRSGIDALAWLSNIQTAPNGRYSPVGNARRFEKGSELPVFDQQPLEAAAHIDACLTASNIAESGHWYREAMRAMHWFLGENVQDTPVAHLGTGGCRDGLTRVGVNQNMGAESTLAYLSSLCAMQEAGSAVSPDARHQGTLR